MDSRIAMEILKKHSLPKVDDRDLCVDVAQTLIQTFQLKTDTKEDLKHDLHSCPHGKIKIGELSKKWNSLSVQRYRITKHFVHFISTVVL